jgi:hypothetical protein
MCQKRLFPVWIWIIIRMKRIINSRQKKPHSIVLVEVETKEEEHSVFQALTSLHSSRDIIIVPVRREFSLALIIAEIAREQGNPLQIWTFREFNESSLIGLSQKQKSPSPVGQSAIISIGDIDEEMVFLAHYLSGGSALQANDIETVSRDGIQRVLVIYTGTSPQNKLTKTLSRLSQQKVPFSLLLVDKPFSGRLAILKAFLFPSVEIDGADWLSELSSLNNTSSGTPKEVKTSPSLSRNNSSILVLSGHGNAVDVGKGGSIICARSTSVVNPSYGLYPCFFDGLCFRQPIFSRSPESNEGLISPESFNYPVVLLLGCGTMPLSNNPFEASNTILGCLNESHSIAGVATIGVFYSDPYVESLLAALLLDGYCLGDVVQLFNNWYREIYGDYSSPADGGLGPLVAFGNPDFRIRSSLVKKLKYKKSEKQEISISLKSDDLSENNLAVLKVENIDDSYMWGLYTPTGVEGAAVQILNPDEHSAPYVYLLIKCKEKSKMEQPAKLLALDVKNRHQEAAALRESIGLFPFWRIFLTQISESLGQKESNSTSRSRDPIYKCDQIEPLLLRHLSMNPFGTGNILPSSELIAIHDYLISLWSEWQKLMLETTSLYIKLNGGFTFQLWHNIYRHLRNVRRLRKCPNCGEDILSLCYSSHLNPSDERDVIHCSTCGVLGELPSSVGVIALGLKKSYPCGKTMSVHFEVEAIRDIALIGYFTVIRECWFHKKADIAKTFECRISPGNKQGVIFDLSISGGLTEGLYPLTLVGILNGGLVHLRFHMHISSDAPTKSRRNP